MTSISVNISSELNKKLALVAEKSGINFDECVSKALNEYIEQYEDIYNADICSVGSLERSFFLSIGE